MKKTAGLSFAIAAVVLLVASTGLLLEVTRGAERSPREPTAAVASAGAPQSPRDTAPTAIRPIADEPSLVAHLSEIEADARVRGVVTDADSRRGTAAIESLSNALGKPRVAIEIRKFGERMTLLRKELALKPITDDLAALTTKIVEAQAGKRASLIADYRTTASRLPERERLDALEKLKKLDPGSPYLAGLK